MTPIERLTAALPANPHNDGPIGVAANDLRALLAGTNHTPQQPSEFGDITDA